MSFLSNIPLKIGVTERNQFDLSGDLVSTTDFFRITPIRVIPTVPGGKYNIKLGTFTRLSPMSQPMFGRAKVVNRAFFVPNRIVMRTWNSFITDTAYSDHQYQNVIPSKVTTFNSSDVCTMFMQTKYSAVTQNSATADFADYSGQNPNYHYFTALGRRAWQILCGLGYRIDLADASKSLNVVTYNALPLLAFYKIYKDWYANQAYESTEYNEVFDRVNGNLASQDLEHIFDFISTSMYDKDYFTAAQDHPVVPNDSLVGSAYSISDISNDRTASSTNASAARSLTSPVSNYPSTPHLVSENSALSPSSAGATSITQYILDQLKALTDFTRRNSIVGSKVADRLLARFGLKPSDAALNQSTPFGKDIVPIQISDVMATATGEESTSGSQTKYSLLGDYAGKGVGYGSTGFNMETDEYGTIIIVSTLVPTIGYVQGSRRYNTSYINRLDFFTPEFDGKSGCQAIRRDELKSDYMMNLSTAGSNLAPDAIFGFIPRWADLKTGYSDLNGDFIFNSRNTPGLNGIRPLDSWHLFRMFPDSASAQQLTHNINFTRGEQSQYDRIFAYTGTEYDHFIMIYNFNINASLPMAKLFDTYEFDGGREIPMEVGGTQLN